MEQQLPGLIAEMERRMALDQIIEARKIVDAILHLNQKDSISVFTKSQRQRMQEIVTESDHVSTLLYDMQNDEGWTLSRCKHDTTVHYRHEPPSPIHAVKTRSVFQNVSPSDFVNLCALFVESDLMPLWFPRGILKACDVLALPTNYHQVVRMKLSTGRFSPISPRDAVVDAHGYHLTDLNGIIVFSKSIETSPYCDIPPPRPPFVRMETQNAFFIQLLPGNRIVFCQISHDDLKVKYMPAWLLNFISEGAVPFEVVMSLQKALSNFSGSEWEKRVQSRRDCYQEIEDRLAEELALMEQNGGVAELEWPSPPLPTEASSRLMRVEILSMLAVVGISFAVGLTWGMLLSIILVMITWLVHRRRRHLQAQLDESPQEKKKQERAPTKQTDNRQATELTRNGGQGSLKKNGRGKSVRRLVKSMSAPIGMVRNRQRRRNDDKKQVESDR
jgi:hypothetical protein